MATPSMEAPREALVAFLERSVTYGLEASGLRCAVRDPDELVDVELGRLAEAIFVVVVLEVDRAVPVDDDLTIERRDDGRRRLGVVERRQYLARLGVEA